MKTMNKFNYESCAQLMHEIYKESSIYKSVTVTHDDRTLVMTTENGARVHTATISPKHLVAISSFYSNYGDGPDYCIKEALRLLIILGNLCQTEQQREDSFGNFLNWFSVDERQKLTMMFAISLEKGQGTIQYNADFIWLEDCQIPNAPIAFIQYIIDMFGVLDEPYYRTKEIKYFDSDDNIISGFSLIIDKNIRMEERALSSEEIEVTKSMYPFIYYYRATLEGEQIWSEYDSWYRKTKIDEMLITI